MIRRHAADVDSAAAVDAAEAAETAVVDGRKRIENGVESR